MDQSFCGSPGPRLVHEGHVYDDSQGNQDGFLDPGDIVVLQVGLLNEGPLPAIGLPPDDLVRATLSSTDSRVEVLVDEAEWPPLGSQESASSNAPHYTIDVAPDFPCGKSIIFQLDAESTEGSWTSEFAVGTGRVVGANELFHDDMESGVNGWTTVELSGNNAWFQTNTASNSPVHSWFIQDVPILTDSALVMPAIDALPAGATLRFAHVMSSEAGFDGGVLEYSTGGDVWVDTGALITSGRYNSVMHDDTGSPVGGRVAWSGTLGLPAEWRTVEVDLSPLEGETVALRWRFATDQDTGAGGWWIDDVVLEAPQYDCTAPHRRMIPGARCRGHRSGHPPWPPGACGQQRPGRPHPGRPRPGR
jgi:hypothetical protein